MEPKRGYILRRRQFALSLVVHSTNNGGSKSSVTHGKDDETR